MNLRSFAEAVLCACVLAAASCADSDPDGSADRIGGASPADAGGAGEAGAVLDAEGVVGEDAGGTRVDEDAAPRTGGSEDADSAEAAGRADDGRVPRRGGTLRVAVEAEGDGINPAANNFAAPSYVMALPVIEPLVYWDADGSWTPYLAEEVTKLGTGSSWQLKVRENVLFHDGSELDADDVIATFEAQYDDPIIARAVRPIYDPSEPIAKIDDYTVQYNLTADHARYPALLTGQLGMVLPSEWVARALRDPSLNQAPAGTGPFTVEERVVDEVTVLRRNAEYWAADTVDIYLDAIEVYPVTESSEALDLLASGGIDAMITSSADAIVALREADGVYTIENAESETDFIMLNTSEAPFDDLRARRAIALATPRDAFVESMGRGVAPPADTIFHPDAFWHNPDVEQLSDMPEMAAPLVQAYCTDHPDNCDSGRINAEFQYAGPSQSHRRSADLLTGGWDDYFNITSQAVPQDDHILRVALGQFDIVTWRQFGEPEPDESIVWLSCDSIGIISPNWPRYCDERRDAAMHGQRSADDPQARRRAWHEVGQSIRDSHAYIFLTHTNWAVGARDSVRNVCGQVSPGSGAELLCNERGRVLLSQVWLG